MEVYMDDMITKSLKAWDHLKHLEETFSNLWKCNMKLNPDKCTFGVQAGKFLGYMVSEQGIEANLQKIKAILDLKSPSTLKELQSLTGRLAALSKYLSKATDRCFTFFHIMKKGKMINGQRNVSVVFKSWNNISHRHRT